MLLDFSGPVNPVNDVSRGVIAKAGNVSGQRITLANALLPCQSESRISSPGEMAVRRSRTRGLFGSGATRISLGSSLAVQA
jgi:hypothetical protein